MAPRRTGEGWFLVWQRSDLSATLAPTRSRRPAAGRRRIAARRSTVGFILRSPATVSN